MILDKNCWGIFLKKTSDMKPIYQWLEKRKGKLVYSDLKKILIDGGESKKMTIFINERSRVGQTKCIDSSKVEEAITEIKESNTTLKSNDIHIFGLAKASNTKLLCSNDQKLQKDFKKIIRNGSIYKSAKHHQHLLTKDVCP